MCTMESEQVFLKWNNFENNLASGFADLLQQEAMVDVTLAVEGKLVQAHKVVLSICSSYFKSIFQLNPCQHPVVILKDVGFQELTDMLDFMYRGEANVKQQDLPSFLRLAETLKVKGLAGGCSEASADSRYQTEDSRKESGIINTKHSSLNEVKEGSRDISIRKSQIVRKRRKRSGSPMKALDLKSNTRNDRSEVLDKCDNDLERRYSYLHDIECIKIKEEKMSDASFDSCGEEVADNEVPEYKLIENATKADESSEIIQQGEEMTENDMSESKLIPGPSKMDESSEIVPQGETFREGEYLLIEIFLGMRLLIVGGHMYRSKIKSSSKSQWTTCFVEGCPGKGILLCNGTFILHNIEHNHGFQFEKIREIKMLHKLRELALGSEYPGPSLLQKLNINTGTDKYLKAIEFWRGNQKKIGLKLKSSVAGRDYRKGEYRFFENSWGTYFILLNSYTYRRRKVYKQKCYWTCSFSKCSARGFLSNGIFRLTHPEHCHKPMSLEKLDHKKNLVQLKKHALKLNIPGQKLLKTLNLEKDSSKYLSAIRSWRSRQKGKSLEKHLPEAARDYKIVKSKKRKKMIVHSGFTYRLDFSSDDKDNGKSVKYWRCRQSNCRGRAKTDPQGNLFIINPQHNHAPETEDSYNKITSTGDLASLPLQHYAREEKTENVEISAPHSFIFCSSAPEAETYSIEKLMADNMEENYGVTSVEYETIKLNLNR